MPTATWNGAVIAQASDDQVQIVENNVYFPLSSVRQDYLEPSNTETKCGWKGTASYYDVVVDGETNDGAAWYYPQPMDGSVERVKKDFKDYVAFWRGVEVHA